MRTCACLPAVPLAEGASVASFPFVLALFVAVCNGFSDVFYFEYLVCLTLVMKKNLRALSYTFSSYEPHLI